MTTPMGPPPARNPNPSPFTGPQTKTLEDEPSTSTMKPTPMGPPPPKNPNLPPSNSEILESSNNDQDEDQPQSNSNNIDIVEPLETASENPTPEPSAEKLSSEQSHGVAVPYSIPDWSGAPCHAFYLEVLKDGAIIDQFDVNKKGAYMFGRIDLCDFMLEHPTISRFHAVLQFKRNGSAYLYDLGSTHGTFINKSQVKKKVYMDLRVGDVIRFGHSSRLYIFQGPPELMPLESDLKMIRDAKILEELQDQKASLQRARLEASLADGISWGMGEDAIEEAEDDSDEITWQSYKGQLTEKQEKTRDKIIIRTEKIANMKKEIDAIRSKDINQGGLTQGQQTQIARNEQRITQIVEELENLEETLNESIRESIGARAGKMSNGKRKGATEDDEEFMSDDDDEFYDRTKKKPTIHKAGEAQSIETADTLLDKRDAILKDMEDKKELLLVEKNKLTSDTAMETEAGDALDAYMSGLSSQLVLDKTGQLEKELSALQSELDRIIFLLKIADPTGEAAKKRDYKVQEPKPNISETSATAIKKQIPVKPKKSEGSGKLVNDFIQREGTADATVDSINNPKADKIAKEATEGKAAVYTVVKPQWLGAIEETEIKETQKPAEVLNIHGSDQFVDYKDRKKILSSFDDVQVKVDSEIESAAPGLIIRKQKQLEKSGPVLMAEDAVALLLKHKRGYHAEDDNGVNGGQDILSVDQSSKDDKKPKRVLGPQKPSFLNSSSDYESWVPPEGQSGDGRTSLNDRYGY